LLLLLLLLLLLRRLLLLLLRACGSSGQWGVRMMQPWAATGSRRAPSPAGMPRTTSRQHHASMRAAALRSSAIAGAGVERPGCGARYRAGQKARGQDVEDS
jgi:hypothetical protein